MTIHKLLITTFSVALATLASADQAWVALSKVDGINAFKGQVGLFGVEGTLETLPLTFQGSGAELFEVTEAKKENGLLMLEIAFKPGAQSGYFPAELLVGRGAKSQLVQVRGIATPALEGKNEPALQTILNAVGAGIDAGGKELKLPTDRAKIGDSLATSQFAPVEGETVRITPVARYSPKGETPFGFAIKGDDEIELIALGSLAETTESRPDAHQTLRPPLTSQVPVVEVADPPARFGLYLQAHQYTSLTFPGMSEGASIKHTARTYPISRYSGRTLQNSYIVGFEEAANGDYQDAVFLIEGVKAVK